MSALTPPNHSPSHKGPALSTLATVLLVEPDTGRAASRSLFLQAARYAVIVVKDGMELQALSGDGFISIVVLSEGLKRAGLRGITESSRRKWPSARILVLGRAQRILEDNLYDEAIEEPFEPKQLLDALAVLLLDPWNQRPPPTQMRYQQAEKISLVPPPKRIVPKESDPSSKKVAAAAVRLYTGGDTPPDERLDHLEQIA